MDGAARKAWLKMTLKNREIFFCVCCCCCCCSFCSSFFIYFVCCISIHVDLQLFWNKYFDYSRFGISRKVRQESIQLTIQRRFDFNGLSRALVFRFYFLFSFSELLTAFPPPSISPNRDCENDDEIHHWPTDGFWDGNEGLAWHQ